MASVSTSKSCTNSCQQSSPKCPAAGVSPRAFRAGVGKATDSDGWLRTMGAFGDTWCYLSKRRSAAVGLRGLSAFRRLWRMTLREISEAGGRSWKVWDTFPSGGTHNPDSVLGKFLSTPSVTGNIPAYVSLARRLGWLTFESGSEKRRLSPVPDRWYKLEESLLLVLLSNAEVVPRAIE